MTTIWCKWLVTTIVFYYNDMLQKPNLFFRVVGKRGFRHKNSSIDIEKRNPQLLLLLVLRLILTKTQHKVGQKVTTKTIELGNKTAQKKELKTKLHILT